MISNKVESLTIEAPLLGPSNPQDEATIRWQKVYKSFRTRRKLPDCAVLVEQKGKLSGSSVPPHIQRAPKKGMNEETSRDDQGVEIGSVGDGFDALMSEVGDVQDGSDLNQMETYDTGVAWMVMI
ncbi:hypothetical protein V6N13_037530 [Hibiscus sabdariffa]